MAHEVRSIEDARALEGVEVGVSDWILVDQERIDRFARATEDFQWIHVDPERAAKELETGATIAHGYLTLSLIPGATEEFVHFPTLKRAINWGLNKVRFSRMVVCGNRVRVRTTVLKARARLGGIQMTCRHRIEIDGQNKPACTAETLGLYMI
ncbi:MAG: MaoC family dehydratase [Gammaproteobacteria bacterium]|nr:MaoC family dehydratase [Gammaproteobacteria bacterium]